MMEYIEIDKELRGNQMYSFMKSLFPICRSITGNGVRETLLKIKEYIPINIEEVPSGTQVFDWRIPKEWNINDAYIKNKEGQKIIDFNESNIHVLNYSIPVNKKISMKELNSHLFTLEEYPEWIPYQTSYYKENWGFCITHNQYETMKDDNYEIYIDSTLENGSLTYGELYFRGKTEKEILFSTYICHPSLCNDNLSGVVLLTKLAEILAKQDLFYSYRFIFIPETIGAITWLSRNENEVKNIKCGIVSTCVGDKGDFTYKKTRNGKSEIDKIVELVLRESGYKYNIIDFFPSGSDERQFSSPGFNLEIGSLMRTPYAKFKEYHTSADNLDFVQPEFLALSLEQYLRVIFYLENNKTYLNLNPKCEPQLGRRGLYNYIGSQKKGNVQQIAILWVLNLSDGQNSLLEITNRSGLEFKQIKVAADALKECKLLKEVKD